MSNQVCSLLDESGSVLGRPACALKRSKCQLQAPRQLCLCVCVSVLVQLKLALLASANRIHTAPASVEKPAKKILGSIAPDEARSLFFDDRLECHRRYDLDAATVAGQ